MSDNDMIRRGDVIAIVSGLSVFSEHASDAENAKAVSFIHKATTALRALPAVQVTVKPLEWVEIRPDQYFESRVIGILYSVRLGTDGVARWQAGHMAPWHEAPTIEAAKAAAQVEYEGRIRSALTVQPSPDVAALVEAVDHLLHNYLLDEHDEPDLCIDDDHWSAIHNTFTALARVKGGGR